MNGLSFGGEVNHRVTKPAVGKEVRAIASDHAWQLAKLLQCRSIPSSLIVYPRLKHRITISLTSTRNSRISLPSSNVLFQHSGLMVGVKWIITG